MNKLQDFVVSLWVHVLYTYTVYKWSGLQKALIRTGVIWNSFIPEGSLAKKKKHWVPLFEITQQQINCWLEVTNVEGQMDSEGFGDPEMDSHGIEDLR